MLSRLGYDAAKMIDPRAFDDLKKFNTTQTAALIGTATQKITQEGLEVISDAIRKYEREAQYGQTGVQRNDNARKARIQHGIVRGRTGDTGGYSERGAADGIPRQADEPLVSVQRGAESVRSPARSSERRGAPDREILDGAQGLSPREEIPDVRGAADERRAEQTLQRDQTGGHSDGAAANETDDSSRRSEQRIAEQELVGVRAGNEQSSTESDRDSDERTHLQLTDNQEETAENGEKSDSAVSVPEEKPDYLESETDRFYDYPDAEHIDGIYYNPDGNDGNGQYVTVNSSYDLILEARDKTSNANEFFDYLNQYAEVYLADRGDYFFTVVENTLSDEPIFTGATEETMKGLIGIAERALQKEDNQPTASRWQPTEETLSVSDVVSSYTTSHRNYTFYLLEKENGTYDIRVGERPDGKKSAYPPDNKMLGMDSREAAEKYFGSSAKKIWGIKPLTVS